MSILDTLREIWPARLVSCAALLALSSVVMLCLAGCIPPGPEQTGVRFGQVEVLARAKGFFEGPAYDAKTGNLYYVNVGDREGRVWQIDPEGKLAVYVKTGSPANNSAVIGPDGALYIAQNSTKTVLRIGGDRKITKVAAGYGPAKIPGPNDMAFRRDGSFYFTCPDWSGRKDPIIGSVFFVSRDGKAKEVASGLSQPNGIGLSPDEKTLYVALTGADSIMNYRVRADGSLGRGRTFIQFEKPAAPDGMVVDADGTIYQALHMAGSVVAVDSSGQEVARLNIGPPRGITNCDLGPEVNGGGKKLYITLVPRGESDVAIISVIIKK